MVFKPSLPPNHSKTTRILPDCSAAASRAGAVQHEWDRPDAAEEAKAKAAGADPDHVAPRDSAVAQSTLACHHPPPLRGRNRWRTQDTLPYTKAQAWRWSQRLRSNLTRLEVSPGGIPVDDDRHTCVGRRNPSCGRLATKNTTRVRRLTIEDSRPPSSDTGYTCPGSGKLHWIRPPEAGSRYDRRVKLGRV